MIVSHILCDLDLPHAPFADLTQETQTLHRCLEQADPSLHLDAAAGVRFGARVAIDQALLFEEDQELIEVGRSRLRLKTTKLGAEIQMGQVIAEQTVEIVFDVASHGFQVVAVVSASIPHGPRREQSRFGIENWTTMRYTANMNRQAKAQRIVAVLDELIPDVPIPLAHQDPFTLLVAVMLSAQTTDKKVNEVTPALFRAASTPEAMAALGVPEIATLIREIGLAPTKAKNLQRMSVLLVARHHGQVPASFEALESLPGVGHKTASVVMAQAFGVPAFPVDTHIHRLAARWGLSSGKNVLQTETDLKQIFERALWNRLHLQIIYFGRQYCPARNHDLADCPICRWAATGARIREEAARRSPRKRV